MHYFKHLLKQGPVKGKLFKIILLGFLIIFVFAVIFLAVAVILAVKYHTQIYDGFMRAINFVFGDSPDNVIRNIVRQLIDNFFKNLLSGN